MKYPKKDPAGDGKSARGRENQETLSSQCVHSTIAHTPASNTGYNSQNEFNCSVDWLDITFRNSGGEQGTEEIIKELEAIADDSFNFSFTKPVFNGRSWDGSGFSDRGARLWFDNGISEKEGEDDKPTQLKISLPGKVMSSLNLFEMCSWLISRAGANELDCTRIDLCVDDKDRCVKLEEIAQARETGNFFNASYSSIMSSSKRGHNEGTTIYFGHPSSHKRLRIYDKTVESNGVVDCIRWEAQYRKVVASEVLFDLLEKVDEGEKHAAEYISSIVTGVIDFRNRAGNEKNRGRCPVLVWFERFCDALSTAPLRVVVPKKEPLVQRSIDWIDKSVVQSLAVVSKVLGTDFNAYFKNALREGAERLNNRKRDLIARTDKQQLIYSTS